MKTSHYMSIEKIIILGGGPAGLAAGYYLEKKGIQPLVLEADDVPGGNCKTVKRGEFRYDFGAHRLHNVYEEITEELKALLGDDLQMINVPSHVYFNNKWARFPLTPGGLLKVLGPAHVAKAIGEVLVKSGKNKETFREDAINKYGKMVAENFLLNYSEKLWGLPTEKLSPKVSGKRLKGLSVKSVLKDVLFKKHSEHLDGAFYYPKYGFGQLMEEVSKTIQHLNFKSRVTKIYHENGKLTTVEINGNQIINGERFINTLPLNMFLHLLTPSPPTELLEAAKRIKFRDVRLVILVLDKPKVSKSASLYFPSSDIPFTRVYEPKQRSKYMGPKEQTCIVVEYPCFRGDEISKMPLEQIVEKTINHLEQVGLVNADEVIANYEEYLPYAYPVLELQAEKDLQILEGYLDTFTNLNSIGRGALFEYTHFHDLMHEAKLLAQKFS